jgi:uncharacterized membrane protein YeaQ/YmgE (transglycosylase-associated protein family)
MSVLAWIALGLVLGAIVGVVAQGWSRDAVANVVVSVLGAVLGGFILAVTMGLDITGIDTSTLLAAVAGALLLMGLLALSPAEETYD